MIRGSSSIIIHQPVDVVFAMLPAIGTAPGAAYSSIEQIPGGSVGVGTIFVQKASGLTNVTEVTEYAPTERLPYAPKVLGGCTA